jgi:hypothetical protein
MKRLDPLFTKEKKGEEKEEEGEKGGGVQYQVSPGAFPLVDRLHRSSALNCPPLEAS